MKKSELREIIKEELNESKQLNKAYDNWHNASSALLKIIRKEMTSYEVDIFLETWDKADNAFMDWFNENDPF